MATLELRNIGKSFGDTEVLRDISLTVEDGTFLSLVGQSGCGKSTLLRIISGLERPSRGQIFMDGQDVTELAPKARNVAMVFQDYALYPHMSVAENMAMPLVMAQVPMGARLPLMRRIAPAARKAQTGIDAKLREVAAQLRIDHLLDRRPAQLSGGQRQRVALGRALVRDPGLFLMDEPLSNLDAKLRVDVRREITELHAASGLTFVYVTHDQTEAMTMSSQVALMQGGEILQAGPPSALYSDPVSVDVARFIGAPEINILPVQIRDGAARLGDQTVPLGLADGDVQLGLRPEALSLPALSGLVTAPLPANAARLGFDKTLIEDLGPELLIHGRFSAEPEIPIRIRAQKNAHYSAAGPLAQDGPLEVAIDPAQILVFDGTGKRMQIPAQRVQEPAQ